MLGYLACGVCATAWAIPAAAQSLLWSQQIGTSSSDQAQGLGVDGAGHAYLAGFTTGSLGGPNAGGADAFLGRYDASGTRLWIRQTGTPTTDHCFGVAVDGAGEAYISGYTFGSLGGPNLGEFDAFLAKYDASGTPLWARQIGTPLQDYCYAVAADAAGHAYITGSTEGSLGGPNTGLHDAFLARFDASGAQLWIRQIGTPASEAGKGVAVEDGGGHVYITGGTQGSLGAVNAGNYDAFLAKYDAAGALLWTRQIGTPSLEDSVAVAVDGAGDVYFSGYTQGSLAGSSAGGNDAFLAKYDTSGVLVWKRQVGTPSEDLSLAVAVDAAGHAYITGYTEGSLAGSNAGSSDPFLAKYDASGTRLWIQQIGSPAAESSRAVAVDPSGGVFIGGRTGGSLAGPFLGGTYDAWLARYGESCYPDCNTDGSLTVADFGCFQTRFVAADPYADCTADSQLTVADFGCFQTKFVAGCP